MTILQQIVNGLLLGSVYMTVAIAFTLTIGVLNFLNFTIPTLFMLSAMLAWAASHFGLPFGLAGPLPWPAALGLGIVAAMLASLVVERFTFRFLKMRFGDSTEHAIPLVSSLGFLLVIENLVRIAFGSDTRRFEGPAADLSFDLGGISLRAPQAASLVFVVVVVLGLNWLLRRTSLGRGLRAIAENPDAASILGVDTRRIVPVMFVLTGLLCGIAAAIFTINYREVSPQMADDIGAKAIAGMVLGGLGSLWGAVAGGLIVGVVETLATYLLGAETIQIAVWSLLLATLLVRPTGLFGHHAIGKGKL